MKNIVKERPAETAMPIVTVFAALIGKALGVEDTDTILYIGLALSFIPAIVTYIVEQINNSRTQNERVEIAKK